MENQGQNTAQHESTTGAIDWSNAVYNSNSTLTPLFQALLSYDSIVLVVLAVKALVIALTNQ